MHGGLITDLAIVTMVAAAMGMLMRRLGQPNILGYLLAGLIVGPYIPIPLFADPHRMEDLAEIGVVLVMFAIGLEFRIRRLLEILPVSGFTAGVQIAALAWAGFTVGSVMGWSTAASVCLGATLAISSTMVVSAVLRTRPVDADIRTNIFGILVVQDVVAIVLIAVVTGLAAGENVSAQSLGLLLGQLTGVVVLMLVAGLLVLPRLVRFALDQGDSEALVVLVVGAAFGLAMAADMFGYSVALGAFVAGVAVAESGRAHDVETVIEPLRGLFSAIFFVSIGMAVDPVVALSSLPLALVLCAVVIVMQFGSVTVATLLGGGSLRRGVYTGLALGQIGELSFILATIAVGGQVVPEATLSALVTLATVTAFTTPLLLGRALPIIEGIDRALPDRVHQALAAYQTFIRRTRAPRDGPSLRRPAIAVVLDWVALVVLFVARNAARPLIPADYSVAVDIIAVVVAAPFLIGLVRSGLRLAAGVRTLARGSTGATPRALTVEAIALLAVVLGVGVPTLALTRPFVEGPWIEAALLGALLAVLVVVGLAAGRLRHDHTSGVAQIALDLARHVGADESEADHAPEIPSLTDPGILAGLDYVAMTVREGGPADGKSLAAIDLRCRTGATVVAIFRGEHMVTLPTGHEELRAGDVLSVSGAPEALDRARSVLEGAGSAVPIGALG